MSGVVAVIGPQWLTATDSSGNRLIDREHDWVREDIARALARNIPIVPVLLRGAEQPPAAKLPTEIKRLADHQWCEISFERLGEDVWRLVENLVHQVPELLLPRLFEPETKLPPGHLPSALLRAEYEVVPFAYRGAELDQLHDWANSQLLVSTLLVTGPGGQGKTRLARQLCAELREQGWVTGIVASRAPPSRYSAGWRTADRTFTCTRSERRSETTHCTFAHSVNFGRHWRRIRSRRTPYASSCIAT